MTRTEKVEWLRSATDEEIQAELKSTRMFMWLTRNKVKYPRSHAEFEENYGLIQAELCRRRWEA